MQEITLFKSVYYANLHVYCNLLIWKTPFTHVLCIRDMHANVKPRPWRGTYTQDLTCRVRQLICDNNLCSASVLYLGRYTECMVCITTEPWLSEIANFKLQVAIVTSWKLRVQQLLKLSICSMCVKQTQQSSVCSASFVLHELSYMINQPAIVTVRFIIEKSHSDNSRLNQSWVYMTGSCRHGQ